MSALGSVLPLYQLEALYLFVKWSDISGSEDMTHLAHVPQEAPQGSHADAGYEPQHNVLHRNSTGIIFQDNITCTPCVHSRHSNFKLIYLADRSHAGRRSTAKTQGLEMHKVAIPMHATADPEALTLQARSQ